DPGYAAYQKINELNQLGGEMLELGFPADAVRYYGELLQSQQALEQGQRYFGNAEYIVQQARSGLDRALQGLNRDSLAQPMRALLKPGGSIDSGGQALDLVLLVHPRELDRALVTSLFASVARSAAKSKDLLAELKARLKGLLDEYPKDFSVQAAAALV